MNTKKGVELEVNKPKRELNEWDSGNIGIYSLAKNYERQIEKLFDGQPEENVRAYTDFLKRAKFEGISISRRGNYLLALRALKEVMGKRLVSTINKDDVQGFLDKISVHSQATVKIRFYCLKKFLKFLGKVELLGDLKPPPEGDVKVKASDLLTREELEKILQACPTVRGKAFLMMLYESGARIGELLNLRVCDVLFDPNGALVEINGKTGRRRIRLVESAQHLSEWLKELKATRPNAIYAWVGVRDNQPSKYPATTKFIKDTAKLAGLRKRVYPHLFRHSRASELAQKLREPQLRAFMGWTGASDIPQVYIHLSAQDMDRAILELYHKDETPKTEMQDIMKFFDIYKQMKAL